MGRKAAVPEVIVDPTAWVVDNSFAEFLTSGTKQIKFMCMLGYTFYHGYKVFSKLPKDSAPSYKFVNHFLACTGGGILVPIFINMVPVPLVSDLYPLAIVSSFLIHHYFPIVREVLGMSAIFKSFVIVLYEVTRAYVVVALTSAAGAAIPASTFSFPVFGPIICGAIAGSGGMFMPLNKGLEPIKGGMQPPMLTALIGAAAYHIFMNTWLSEGVIDAKAKCHIHMAVFFICIGQITAFGLTADAQAAKAKKPTVAPPM